MHLGLLSSPHYQTRFIVLYWFKSFILSRNGWVKCCAMFLQQARSMPVMPRRDVPNSDVYCVSLGDHCVDCHFFFRPYFRYDAHRCGKGRL